MDSRNTVVAVVLWCGGSGITTAIRGCQEACGVCVSVTKRREVVGAIGFGGCSCCCANSVAICGNQVSLFVHFLSFAAGLSYIINFILLWLLSFAMLNILHQLNNTQPTVNVETISINLDQLNQSLIEKKRAKCPLTPAGRARPLDESSTQQTSPVTINRHVQQPHRRPRQCPCRWPCRQPMRLCRRPWNHKTTIRINPCYCQPEPQSVPGVAIMASSRC